MHLLTVNLSLIFFSNTHYMVFLIAMCIQLLSFFLIFYFETESPVSQHDLDIAT